MPDDTLRPPPHLPVPDDIQLLTGAEQSGDARLVRLQLLENWARVYQAHATALLRELWNDPDVTKTSLKDATGMTWAGVRRRADPAHAAEVNRRRRKHPDPPQGHP